MKEKYPIGCILFNASNLADGTGKNLEEEEKLSQQLCEEVMIFLSNFIRLRI